MPLCGLGNLKLKSAQLINCSFYNHLEIEINMDLSVEHEDKVLFDSGLVDQPVIQQAYLNDCLLLYNNLKMDYSKDWMVPNDGRK